mgnify:CR=1 FL=1
MTKLDPKRSYLMPAHFGPRYAGEKTSGWYHDVTTIMVPYVTDRDALLRVLPDCFDVPEQAVITVAYAGNKDIDWLAGHGYNLIGVHASVIYKGDTEQLVGSYTLVMWENLTDPILAGRELQGISKIYADIPDHYLTDDTWHTKAQHFGHDIMNLSITSLAEVPLEVVEAQQKANKATDNPMGYRYMPTIGGWGPGMGQATLFPSENKFTEVKLGAGQVNWNHLTWEQNPTQFHIANGMADLPIIEYLPAAMTKGSANLFVPDRLSRALR